MIMSDFTSTFQNFECHREMTILTTMTNVVSVFGAVMRAFAYSTFLMESGLLAHATITQSLVSVITQLCSVWARLCVCVDISSSVIKAGAWHRNYDCSRGGEADMRGLMFLKAFITGGAGVLKSRALNSAIQNNDETSFDYTTLCNMFRGYFINVGPFLFICTCIFIGKDHCTDLV